MKVLSPSSYSKRNKPARNCREAGLLDNCMLLLLNSENESNTCLRKVGDFTALRPRRQYSSVTQILVQLMNRSYNENNQQYCTYCNSDKRRAYMSMQIFASLSSKPWNAIRYVISCYQQRSPVNRY
jgi:hypothetical protein